MLLCCRYFGSILFKMDVHVRRGMMKAVQMEKAYNPKEFEDRIYDYWMQNNLFAPIEGDADPFVIVIPPPNVTGVLHMGHGLNNSLQDILIRYFRMQDGRHSGFPEQTTPESPLSMWW